MTVTVNCEDVELCVAWCRHILDTAEKATPESLWGRTARKLLQERVAFARMYLGLVSELHRGRDWTADLILADATDHILTLARQWRGDRKVYVGTGSVEAVYTLQGPWTPPTPAQGTPRASEAVSEALRGHTEEATGMQPETVEPHGRQRSILSIDQLREMAQHISYRDWSFTFYDGRFEGQHMVINFAEVDAYQRDQQLHLDIHTFVPPLRTEEDFVNYVFWRISRHVVHEAREFFEYRGRKVFDPHAENADRDL